MTNKKKEKEFQEICQITADYYGKIHYVISNESGNTEIVGCDDFDPYSYCIIEWIAFPPKRKEDV